MGNSDSKPVVLGVAGLGGYAASVIRTVLETGDTSTPAVKIAAVGDPAVKQHGEFVAELRGRGIQVFDDFDKVLALPEVDAVWLPLPIPLHRPFMEKALAAGKAVMCEKPAAGSIDDVDAMIAARDKAGLPVAIGFQDVYDPTTVPLKRRLLEGVVGKIKRVSIYGCWPRSTRYFTRSNWAGALKRGGAWVLDSPAQNAMAHYINISLFLLGSQLEHAAHPIAVEAELYRANQIENYDTVSMRAELDDGVSLLVLYTHACHETEGPVIRIEGEKGTVIRENSQIIIEAAGGSEVIPRDHESTRVSMVHRFGQLVRGIDNPDIAVASLEVARQHTLLVNGISEATPIHTIDPQYIDIRAEPGHEDSVFHSVPGINEALRSCARTHQMLHESGRLAFTQPAGRRDLQDYRHFAGPCGEGENAPSATARATS